MKKKLLAQDVVNYDIDHDIEYITLAYLYYFH